MSKSFLENALAHFLPRINLSFFLNMYSKASSFQKDFHFMKQSEGILRSYRMSSTCFCNRDRLVALDF